MESLYCRPLQIINREGKFNVGDFDEFMQKTKLSKCGTSYTVVAVMGPQSSGKSTLLNHLFNTNFREMDASEGRNQTTQGIWMQKCAGVGPCIVAMDLEGSDGSERGEDDTTFEKQSALFALATANIVIINMWCHDVGREHAANKPLLKIVFKVMMKLFGARKTTLLFVLRDKTRTPLHLLQQTLRKDTEKIWDSVRKPSSRIDTPLSEFFKVEVVALSSYEEKEELFKKEVAELRQKLLNFIPLRGFAGDRQGVVPASGFSCNAQQIWKRIKENKDLDLPAVKVMVATIRCEEIANQMFRQLSSNKDWLELMEGAFKSGPVSNFGSKLSSILESYFLEYDKETIDFDEGVRNEKRKQLESKALELVRPSYFKLLERLRFKALENFKSKLEHMLSKGVGFTASLKSCTDTVIHEFDQACADVAIRNVNLDTSEVREKLLQDIDWYKSSGFNAILSMWKVRYEGGLSKALSKQLESLFENPNGDTWASIRKHLTCEIETALSTVKTIISIFDLDLEKGNKMVQDLRDYARNLVEKKAREAAGNVLHQMTVRYSAMLNDAIERKKFSRKISRNAYKECLSLLSVMAAVRLDEKPDKIEEMLFSSLMDHGSVSSKTLASSSTWPEVSPKDTLITPAKCNSLWESFQGEIFHRTQAFNMLKETKSRARKDRAIKIAKTAVSAAALAVSVATLVGSGAGVLVLFAVAL